MNQNLTKLSNLFDVRYGVNLELNKMELCEKTDPEAISFVSRTEKNNGISAIVKKIPAVEPNPAPSISVAGGGSVLASFLQPEPYYSGRDLYVLVPKRKMSDEELLFYCSCIKKNRYKYNYGRQANKTLRDLLLPSSPPAWLSKIGNQNNLIKSPLVAKQFNLNLANWKQFKLSDLFDIERGKGARLRDSIKDGLYPIVTAIDNNNGWSGFSDTFFHSENVISVPRNGNGVAEAFFQPKPFSSTEDVHVFKPKFPLNPFIALFLCVIIRKEKYRYSYGRKWGLQRMNDTSIKLPATKNGNPDWDFMEHYIKSLPFSASI